MKPLLLLCAALAGCNYLALATAPSRQATTTRTEAAIKADAVFWDTLHNGRYEQIPTALRAVTAAYIEDPADAVTAAHAGWLHIWRVAERGRLGTPPPTIINDAMLARRYFAQAVKLDPGEARYLGFLASATLAEGSIHRDEKMTLRGYLQLLDAIDAWPEFNLFTAGYGMSRQPVESERFKRALEWMWRNIEVCVGEKVDRVNPDYHRYMALETTEGSKRVCWNSWIAPHNFEGFFLNMGDMLVKAGDWRTARTIYANARLSSTYAQWKFRDVLEQRIENAPANVAVFNEDAKADRNGGDARAQMMFSSPFACMACHQR